ncbi:hypothetical protein CBR_g52175 [Chara braunii]|uniref:Uncharacterized protein n=1 Tax=Chara braunii TaxID=69332 RepID=A0A388M9R3_CHABU|nr:hypothetical protein CBR_g52175 [Chara braunii]|eukprot:GBG91290.1 hypothetical protein CBR_g52175 [Chara braunii]
MSCYGWKSCLCVPALISSMTVDSESEKTARATCFPAPVSLSNVSNVSSPNLVSDGLNTWRLAIWKNPMLQAIQFPAGIPSLDASLADVKQNTLPHGEKPPTKIL